MICQTCGSDRNKSGHLRYIVGSVCPMSGDGVGDSWRDRDLPTCLASQLRLGKVEFKVEFIETENT